MLSASSPKAKKKADKVGTQSTPNSFTASFTESGCQSFRIADYAYQIPKKKAVLAH